MKKIKSESVKKFLAENCLEFEGLKNPSSCNPSVYNGMRELKEFV